MELIGIYIYKHEELGERKTIILNPNYDIKVNVKNGSEKTVIEFEIIEKQKILPDNFWRVRKTNNNILNLTAIIGENGSGKTTFLHFLINSFSGYDKKQWILFFKKDDNFLYYHFLNLGKIKIKPIGDYKDKYLHIIDSSIIYYSPLLTFRSPIGVKINSIIDISTDYLLLNDKYFFDIPIANFSLKQYHKFVNIYRHICLIEFITKEGNILSEIFPIDKIANIQITINAEDIDKRDFFLPRESNAYSERKKATIFLINTLAFLLSKIKGKREDFISNLLMIKNSLMSEYDLDEISATKEALLRIDIKLIESEINKRKKEILKFIEKKNPIINKAKIKDYLNNLTKNYDKTIKTTLEKIFDFLQLANKINLSPKGTLNFQIPAEKVKNILINIMVFVSLLPEEYQDFIDIEFPLSSGEKSMLDMFSRLYYAKEQISLGSKTVYLFLDEAETSFHPEWQRRFIYSLVQFIQQVFSDYNVQIFLASHSPLLISDIPKQNILFLRRGEKGDIFQIADLDTIPQTFAANLNTILADGFFLGGALIGELARRKIQEQIDKINKGQAPDMQIIEMIGEPAIRDLLMRFLPEEIILKSQIKLLQEKLNKIQNQNSGNNQNNDTNKG